ncbi:hypothetical protein CEXT_13771 [Caerostris extrusa]|uniref:Uncharacterized protein n=1 Tax=Caerostris extrusa TaxID=172846 RepID=A0AAV4S9Y8_CAEEX|nr:hypothetical protein CEXT_13771 [Caerostris extrusa]
MTREPPEEDIHDEGPRDPLFHYVEPLDNILNFDPSDDSFNLLVELCIQVVIEGKQILQILEPKSSTSGRTLTIPRPVRNST